MVPEASFALLALHIRPAARRGRSSFAAPKSDGRRMRVREVLQCHRPAGHVHVPSILARRRRPGGRQPAPRPRRAPKDAARARHRRAVLRAPEGDRASKPSEDRPLASHRWSSPSEVTSRRRPRHLTMPLPPRESDRPRADLPRHPRHRRRISGAGFVLPHRLRRSRPSLLHEAGLPAGCLPPPLRPEPEPLSHPRRTPAEPANEQDSASWTSPTLGVRDGRTREGRLSAKSKLLVLQRLGGFCDLKARERVFRDLPKLNLPERSLSARRK